MQRLDNKACIVTGAARGIGRAIAEAFRAEGATVVATDKDAAGGASMAASTGCRFIGLDVRREADWEALAREIPEADVVVNNAGVAGFEAGTIAHDPEHATLDAWREVHQVNLDGTFLGCHYAHPRDESTRNGVYYQHFLAFRSGGHSAGGRVRLVQSCGAQPHEDSGALFCATGLENPLQLDPPRRDPHDNVEDNAGNRPGPRGAHDRPGR